MCFVSHATSKSNILKRSHMYFSGIVLFPWLSCGYIWLYLVLYLCHEELQNILDVSSCIVPKYNYFPKSSLRYLNIYSRHPKSPRWLYLGGLLILKEARQCVKKFKRTFPHSHSQGHSFGESHGVMWIYIHCTQLQNIDDRLEGSLLCLLSVITSPTK